MQIPRRTGVQTFFLHTLSLFYTLSAETQADAGRHKQTHANVHTHTQTHTQIGVTVNNSVLTKTIIRPRDRRAIKGRTFSSLSFIQRSRLLHLLSPPSIKSLCLLSFLLLALFPSPSTPSQSNLSRHCHLHANSPLPSGGETQPGSLR